MVAKAGNRYQKRKWTMHFLLEHLDQESRSTFSDTPFLREFNLNDPKSRVYFPSNRKRFAVF